MKVAAVKIGFELSGTKLCLPFAFICSLTQENCSGNVIIEYVPRNYAVEYVDAERMVVEFCRHEIIAEELAHKVFEATWKGIKPDFLKVTVDVLKSKAHQPVQVWIERKHIPKALK